MSPEPPPSLRNRSITLPGTVLLVAMVLAFAPGTSRAGWTRNGVGVATRTGAESRPIAITDGSGGTYVGWSDEAAGVFTLTHLDANGDLVAPWPTGGIAVTDLPGRQLVPDGAGGALVLGVGLSRAAVFHVGPDTSIALRSSAGGCFTSLLHAAAGEAGSLLFSFLWTACGNSTFWTTARARPTGTFQWTRTIGHSALDPYFPATPVAVATDFAGGAYLVTRRDTSAFAGDPWHTVFYVNRVDSTGVKDASWPAVGRVVAAAAAVPTGPLIVSDPISGAILLWRETSNGGDRLLAQWISPAGPATETLPLTGDLSRHTRPLAVGDGAGGVFVVWRDSLVSTGARSVMALHADATGTVGHGPTALTLAARDPQPSGLAGDGSGGIYAAWNDDPLALGVQRVFVTRLTPALDPEPGWSSGGLPVCDTPGQDQASLAVVDGNAVLAWRDQRGDPGTSTDIYVARVTPDGVVPVRFSVVEASTRDGVVHVRWHSDDGPASAHVQRAADGFEWRDVGTVGRDGLGFYAFADASVAAGSRWRYRLASSAGDVLTSVVSVVVPGGGLALSGFVGDGPATVALTLASAAPARLEVYDVQGRRQADLRLVGLGAGEQRVPLGVPLRAGIYLLRLTQAEAGAIRRSVRLE